MSIFDCNFEKLEANAHTCSELSRVLPGLPMHFLKHLSVILWKTNINFSGNEWFKLEVCIHFS